MFVELVEGPNLAGLPCSIAVNLYGAFGMQNVFDASFIGFSVGKGHIFVHISNICVLVRVQQHRSLGLMIRGEEIEYSALTICNLQEFSNSLAFNSLDVCAPLIVYLFPCR
jgi:hypothetical protein